MSIVRITAALGAALMLGGCSIGGDDATVAQRDSITLGAGDVRITSEQGNIDLMLVGDQILVALSDSALGEVRRGTDTTDLAGQSGVGANIEKFVKSTVQNALAKTVAYPVSGVRDARVVDGRIELDYRDGEFELLENSEVDDTPLLASFSLGDAERFVAALRARIGSAG